MAFIDELQLHITAGHGGDGVVRWRHEKGKPKSGPGGGNGGRGGDVYVLGIRDLGYLESYRNTKQLQADNGEDGANFGCEGKNGDDLIIKLPIGSTITNLSTGEKISLDQLDQKELLLRGGKGGRGNEDFKSSRNVTPVESTPGQPGDEADFLVELELFADIGLVGLPSAGKSTLLNALTNAHSKVAAYHFTTLEPSLGVLPGGYVLADLPGLIEGASEGKGLGIKFLKHIKRTKMIAHVISCEYEDLLEKYHEIRNELNKYGEGLPEKREVVILSKSDLLSPEALSLKLEAVKKETGKEVIAVSAFDDVALKILQDALIKNLT